MNRWRIFLQLWRCNFVGFLEISRARCANANLIDQAAFDNSLTEIETVHKIVLLNATDCGFSSYQCSECEIQHVYPCTTMGHSLLSTQKLHDFRNGNRKSAVFVLQTNYPFRQTICQLHFCSSDCSSNKLSRQSKKRATGRLFV